MPYNGSGVFSLVAGNPVVTGTVISSTTNNNTNSDYSTAFNTAMCRDGQSTPTANLPMGSFKLTGLAVGTALTDSITLGQAQNQGFLWAGTSGGAANVQTLSPTPTITAYVAGQTFRFKAGFSNSAATTINISAVGAIAVQSNGAACVGGEIVANQFYQITLDTTSTAQIVLIGNPSSVQVAANTFVANATTGTASPTGIALAASQLAGRGSSGNITAVTLGGGLLMTGAALSAPGILNIYNFTAQTQALTSISNASPAVFTVTSANHLPETGSPIQLTTSGGLPTGLSLATTYFVTNASGTTYNVCTTYADALAGTNKVNTSSAGSGTHTQNSIYVKNSASSYVIAEVWGAGGGSGGMTAAAVSTMSAGGNAGGYSRRKVALASLGATETITIGAGGAAGTAGGAGGTGGTSSFGAWATASGGGGSGAATTNLVQGAVGATIGAGASGDINLFGATGSGGNISSSGNTGTGGTGGSTSLGGTPPAPTSTSASTPGVAAKLNSGSGASGGTQVNASAGAVGGLGGSGRVIVWEYA